MSLRPVNLRIAIVTALYNVAVNTNQNFTVLAAPGASFRYRIWTVTIGFGLTTDAPTKWVGVFRDGVTASWAISGDTFRSEPQEFPGGWRLTPNSSFVIGLVSAVTNISFRLNVGYTTDNVT